MSKAIAAVAVLAVSVGGTAVLLQHYDNRALRREVALLRTEVQMLASSRVAEVRSVEPVVAATTSASVASASEGELAKLREEIAGLKKSTQAIAKFAELAQAAQSAKELEKASQNVATKIVPAAQLKNVGKATPEAATESALAAAIAGDVDVVANSLAFTESSRAKADAWFATLSERVRQEYGSAEKVFALMMARDAAGLTGMQVLGTKEVSANNVGVRLRFASEQGTKDDTLLLQRSGDGWRLLLPDQAVENMARKVSGKR